MRSRTMSALLCSAAVCFASTASARQEPDAAPSKGKAAASEKRDAATSEGPEDDTSGFRVSSTLPLYGGLPMESDVPDGAEHTFLLGFNWNAYFFGHYGLGVDADFLLGGSDGFKAFGALMFLYHPLDRWSSAGVVVDPFAGIGMGWTDAPGYYTGDGITTTYNPDVEFTGAAQVGVNVWFNRRIGFIAKTKLFFNRGFDFLQLNAGLNIALFDIVRTDDGPVFKL